MGQYEALLRRAMQENEVVSIHNNESSFDDVYCGYVESISSEECRIRAHRRLGMSDGWIAFRLQDIRLVDVGGKYERRLAYFDAIGGHLFPFPPLEPIEDGSILLGTLRQAKELGIIVNLIHAVGSYIVGGFVHMLSEEEITIAEYDTFGEPDGFATVQLSQVLYVTCGSMECQRTQHLVEHQQEFQEFRRRQPK